MHYSTNVSCSSDPDHARLEFTLNSPESVAVRHNPPGTHKQADVSEGEPDDERRLGKWGFSMCVYIWVKVSFFFNSKEIQPFKKFIKSVKGMRQTEVF